MRFSRRSLRRGLAGTVLFSALAILAVVLVGTRQEVIRAWRRIPFAAFLAGGTAIALVWLAKAGRMWIIARAMGRRLSYRRFVRLYLATCFVAHITPFSAGGVPMQIYLLHREGMTVGSATALTAVDLGANSLAFVLAVPLALGLGGTGFSYRVPAWLGWIAAGVSLLVLGGMIWRRARRPASAGHSRALDRWRKEFRLFRQGLREMGGWGAGSFLAVAGLTLAYWFFYLLVAPIILWGLGVDFSWGYVLGAQLVFNVLQVLLPTPGGSGGSELLLAGLFAPVLQRGEEGVLVLLWKFYTFHATLLLGGLSFWRLLKERGSGPGEIGG